MVRNWLLCLASGVTKTLELTCPYCQPLRSGTSMAAVSLNRHFLALVALCGLAFGTLALAQNAPVPDKSTDSSPAQDTSAKDTASKSSDKKTPSNPDVDLRSRPLSDKQ